MMEHAAVVLFLMGIPLALFTYAFPREQLRIIGRRSRRHRTPELPDDPA